MAVKDGLPSTDFSRQNREYIKAVAESGSGGGGGAVPVPDLEEDVGKTIVVGNDGYELQYPYMLRGINCPITTNQSISLPADAPIVFSTVEADMTDYPDDMATLRNTNDGFIGNLYAVLPLSQKIICNKFYTDPNTPNSIFFDIIIFRTDTRATESISLANNMIVTVVVETNE